MQLVSYTFKSKFTRLLLAFTLCQLTFYSQAEENPTLASQRFHYQKAKVALANHQAAEFASHLQQLDDYPLKQYLEFAQLRSNFGSLPYSAIEEFLTRYSGTFLESRMRANFLIFLASRENWPAFLKYYRDDMDSLVLRCHSLHARIKSGDTSALQETALLWNIGKSRPKQCDPLFKTWTAAGQMTDDLIFSRLTKSVEAKEMRFAQYLSKQLSDPLLQSRAKLLLEVHRNPKMITKRHLFSSHDNSTQHIISHGIKRLAQQAPLDALYQWELYEAQQIFSQDMIRDTKLEVVKRLIRKGHAQEAQNLLNYSRSLREQDLVEELAREALTDLDWPRLADVLSMLDSENQQSDRWQYWAARVQEEMQTPLSGFDTPAAIYLAIAKNRSFYGFLASDKLKQKYSLVDDSNSEEQTLTPIVAELGGMKRAYELWITGNTTEAKAEWLHLSHKLDDEQLLAAGKLARDWGWYNTGIQAMISGNFWNQLTVRFPLAYRDEVHRIANDTQVEPTFIYAIARQESAFDAEARSPVGAMGLMQLMPQTAKFTAQKSGIKHAQTGQLLDAEHNMLLGSHYLNHLLQKFKGNRILAAAAYNAGPHRVNGWLSEEGKERPVDVWIETIPFRETRFYVQNILCFSVIYGYRLGVPTTFISAEETNRYL